MIKKITKKEFLLFSVPVVLGVIILFFKLGSLFQNLNGDEYAFLLISEQLKGEPYLPYLIWPKNLGSTHTLLPYLMQIPIAFFGITNFAVRFIPALFALLGIITFYLLLRSLFENPLTAFIGATLLALTRWYLTISRLTYELSEMLFFAIANLLFLVLFLKSKEEKFRFNNLEVRSSYVYIFAAGVTLGFLQHTYVAARFYLFFYTFFFLFYFFMKRKTFFEAFKKFLIFSFGFLILISPLIYVFIKHPRSFDARGAELVFAQNLSFNDLIWSLKQSTLRTFGMFHLRGSDVSCYNIPNLPMLDPISGLLFLVGLILSFRILDFRYSLVFISFFLFSLLPSILSYWPAAPQGLRAAGSIVPIVLYTTIGLEALAKLLRKYYIPIIVVVISVIAIVNLQIYFKYQPQLQDDCFKSKVENFEDFKKHFLQETGGVKFIR